MLQLAQRTSAPSATSVSISTAVWTVMCSEPVILAPRSGAAWANSLRVVIRPGISCSASRISLRPNSASSRSATLKSIFAAVVLIGSPRSCWSLGSSGREQSLMLVLLEPQPLIGVDVLGTPRLGFEPVLDRLPQLRARCHARRECDVGEPDVEAGEQLFERAQP